MNHFKLLNQLIYRWQKVGGLRFLKVMMIIRLVGSLRRDRNCICDENSFSFSFILNLVARCSLILVLSFRVRVVFSDFRILQTFSLTNFSPIFGILDNFTSFCSTIWSTCLPKLLMDSCSLSVSSYS